jgi:hypothetical protein
MLVSRAQLDVVEELLAEFSRPQTFMQSIAVYRAYHIALVSLLRSIGHVLQKVDADTQAKADWLKQVWQSWREEAIFKRFIEPNRNWLLKEYRGALEMRDPAVTSTVFMVDPSARGSVTNAIDLDVNALKTVDGKLLLASFREAVRFWQKHLEEAERAFAALEGASEA